MSGAKRRIAATPAASQPAVGVTTAQSAEANPSYGSAFDRGRIERR